MQFQASATKQMRIALFCVITQCIVVISYQGFGTTYWSHLQGLKFHPNNMNREVGLNLMETSFASIEKVVSPLCSSD